MRQQARAQVARTTRLHLNGWSSLEIQLTDWSRAGFRAACDARVREGQFVTIDDPELGLIQARVSWIGEGEFSANFLMPQEEVPSPSKPESKLARMLAQRVVARRAGLIERERALRKDIASALPMRRLDFKN